MAIGVNRYRFNGVLDPTYGCEYSRNCQNQVTWCNANPWIVTDWLIVNGNCDVFVGPLHRQIRELPMTPGCGAFRPCAAKKV